MVQQSLKINRTIDNCKYLGLPLFLSNNRRNDFYYVVDNIRARIQHWNNRYLSQAGKEIMLKSVAQSIPTYTMNCFHLPKSLHHGINMLMASY